MNPTCTTCHCDLTLARPNTRQTQTAWCNPLSRLPFVCLSSVEAGMPHTPREMSFA